MAYCTQTDLEHQLSADGVDLRIDDDVSAVAEVLEEADTEIDQACYYIYSQASLAVNAWVKHKAKTIASYLLCVRRGIPAPSSVVEKYQRALEILEKVRQGAIFIPKAVMSKAAAPTMSNVRPTLRPFPRTVVEKNRSTGKPEGYRQNNLDPWDRTNLYLDFQI